MAITVAEIDPHDLEVVDVVEIFTDGGFCVAGAAVVDDKVAGCAICNSFGEMSVEDLEAL